MIRSVSARYWSLKSAYDGTTFADVLRHIYDLGEPGEREITVEPNYIVRLERFELFEKKYVLGEVCRVQRDNIPPAANKDGMSPMKLPNGIGHRSAFISDLTGENVLWQNDVMACPPAKFAAYLSHFGSPKYKTDPVPYTVGDVWSELESAKQVRSFSIKVQPEDNLLLFDPGHSDLMELARHSARAYLGDAIEITISAVSQSKLDKGNVTRTLMQLLKFGGIKKAKAVVSNSDGQFLLDFLNMHRSETGNIERYSEDVDADWRARRGFLLTSYYALRKHDHSSSKDA